VNPVIHSRSSAKHFGGVWGDYIHIHHWLDRSKEFVADFRHRYNFHHEEGIQEAVEVFGDVLELSGGGSVPVASVCRQHILEDCGGIVPTKEWWFKGMQRENWFFRKFVNPKLRRAGVTDPMDHKTNMSILFGGSPEDYRFIVNWFAVPSFHDRAFKHHSGAIFEAERVFGWEYPLESGGSAPTRLIGEEIVRSYYSKIPTMQDWVKVIKPISNMSRNYVLSEVEIEELAVIPNKMQNNVQINLPKEIKQSK
jgi:hypothetical protein